MLKHVMERKLTADRVFNMDEIGFAQKSKSKKVIAVAGSKNVWSKSVEASFHLTIASCAGSNGFVVPSMFIVPGKRLNCDVMDGCSIDNSTISVASKGFMAAKLFLKWLLHFENQVSGTVNIPLVLVYDGYGNQFNDEIVKKVIEINTILVLLPENVTYLIQTLDIVFFKPFQTVLKKRMEAFMIENACTSFAKCDSISISSDSWKVGIIDKAANIISGFKASGIWHLNFTEMQKR